MRLADVIQTVHVMGDTGLEGVVSPRRTIADQAAAGAESGAPIEPDLKMIVDSWPKLPQVLKSGILAMVMAASSH
ncbi:MAG: hypothetical protein L0Y44_06500 [Phycisphaerales bacterium]|nr:hypothetical protein [Phycisphaerales bacterium]MCI0676401.1 hypothetical protein [Phycisphaerales bacterium]